MKIECRRLILNKLFHLVEISILRMTLLIPLALTFGLFHRVFEPNRIHLFEGIIGHWHLVLNPLVIHGTALCILILIIWWDYQFVHLELSLAHLALLKVYTWNMHFLRQIYSLIIR